MLGHVLCCLLINVASLHVFAEHNSQLREEASHTSYDALAPMPGQWPGAIVSPDASRFKKTPSVLLCARQEAGGGTAGHPLWALMLYSRRPWRGNALQPKRTKMPPSCSPSECGDENDFPSSSQSRTSHGSLLTKGEVRARGGRNKIQTRLIPAEMHFSWK